MYLSPFLSPSWWASLKSRGVEGKTLDEILEDIMTKSSIVNPVHFRRIEFLKEKRNNSSHSDFLVRLEERINLIEFEEMTKESLLCHIFLEESDTEMQKLTTELLAKNPKGDLDQLRALVKMTEAKIWYKPGGLRTAKRAGEGAGGGAGGCWCQNCNSGTHKTDTCWGQCGFCNAFGHKTSQCRKNPNNKSPDTGAVKKAGAGEGEKPTEAQKTAEYTS